MVSYPGRYKRMNSRIFALFRKEYFLKFRQSHTISGIVLFSILFCILLAFLLRHLSARVSDLGLIAFPAFWIIFLLTVFRYSLYSYSEEIQSGIFRFQISLGYSGSEIFYVKFLVDTLICAVLMAIQYFVLFILLGIPQIASVFVNAFLSALLALPAVVSLASLGACMSLRAGKEEIMMPVLVLPLLLIISLSVISYSESLFHVQTAILDSFWNRSSIGMSMIMISVSGILFTRIVSIRD
jgi:ABC-type transport system involved in cytochrome c biogenesis permease component